LVREDSQAGSLALVKQYGGWRCQTYTTPYHVSGEIGSGGEASLAHLSVVLEMLYKYYVKAPPPVPLVIKSYLLQSDRFEKLLGGQVHPLSVLRDGSERPWWEDFWDEGQIRKQEYWPGWQSICSRIRGVVASKAYLQEERNLIRSGQHPFLVGGADRQSVLHE
jgi:hypothetical protein